MIEAILEKIWLRANEAKVYLALLKAWTTHAGRIISTTGLAKSSVYNALEYLAEKWLVISYVHTGTTKYAAEEPAKLEYILAKEAKNIRQKQTDLENILPELYGIKNPGLLLPKVRMYEGVEWMRTVLFDATKAHEEVLSYMNIDAMESVFHETKAEYVQERIKNGVKKKIIALDTKKAREYFEYYSKTPTRVRYVEELTNIFQLEFVIYDKKIAYITYRDKHPIGVIIEDEDIYNFHRSMHEQLWKRIT